MQLDLDAFVFTLPYMLKGMAGIFFITALIILLISLLKKVLLSKDKRTAGS